MGLFHLAGGIEGILNRLGKGEQFLGKALPHQWVKDRKRGSVVESTVAELMQLM